jgi:hypothetical protein
MAKHHARLARNDGLGQTGLAGLDPYGGQHSGGTGAAQSYALGPVIDGQFDIVGNKKTLECRTGLGRPGMLGDQLKPFSRIEDRKYGQQAPLGVQQEARTTPAGGQGGNVIAQLALQKLGPFTASRTDGGMPTKVEHCGRFKKRTGLGLGPPVVNSGLLTRVVGPRSVLSG